MSFIYTSKLGKDLVWYALLTAISKGSPLILLPILSKLFTPVQFGLIELVVVIVGFLTTIGSLSLESAVARDWLGKNFSDQRILFTTTLASVILTCSFVCMLMWFFVYQTSLIYEPLVDIRFELLLAVGTGLITVITAIPQIVLRIERRIIGYGLIQISNGLLGIVIAIPLVAVFNLGLFGLYSGFFLAAMVSLVVSCLATKIYFTRHFSTQVLKNCLKYSLPMLPAVALIWLSVQVDKYMLASLVSLSALGLYAAATKVAMILMFLVEVLRLAWFPIALTQIEHANRNTFISKSMNVYLLFTLSVGLIITTYCKEILTALSNAEYAIYFFVVPWLILSQILLGSAHITNIGMLISKKTFGVSVAAAIGVTTNIVITYGLVTVFGVGGAALGSLMSSFIITAILCWRSTLLTKLDFNFLFITIALLIYVLHALGILTTYNAQSSFSLSIRTSSLFVSLTLLVYIWPDRSTLLSLKIFERKA